MPFSIPTNWQDGFFDRVDLAAVGEVFGKLPSDALGGGRASVIFHPVSRRHCPFQALHGNFHSHASQRGHMSGGFPIDYYCLYCVVRIFSDPDEVLKAPWIRPEDLGRYERLGIRWFKLAERGMTTEALARVVSAYTNRTYDGNLMDLFPTMSKYEYIVRPRVLHLARHFGHVMKMNPLHVVAALRKLLGLRRYRHFFDSFGLYVDNRALDGFVGRFEKTDCHTRTCDECGYCGRWRRKAVRLLHDDSDRQRAVNAVTELLEALCDGTM